MTQPTRPQLVPIATMTAGYGRGCPNDRRGALRSTRPTGNRPQRRSAPNACRAAIAVASAWLDGRSGASPRGVASRLLAS